jgi:hypothetical protein
MSRAVGGSIVFYQQCAGRPTSYYIVDNIGKRTHYSYSVVYMCLDVALLLHHMNMFRDMPPFTDDHHSCMAPMYYVYVYT